MTCVLRERHLLREFLLALGVFLVAFGAALVFGPGPARPDRTPPSEIADPCDTATLTDPGRTEPLRSSETHDSSGEIVSVERAVEPLGGIVLDGNGHGVAGVVVLAKVANIPPGFQPGDLLADRADFIAQRGRHFRFVHDESRRAVTDDAGRFHFTRLANVYFTVSVSRPHQVFTDGAPTSLAPPGSDVVIWLTAPLTPSRTIPFDVTDPKGRPLDSAFIDITGPGGQDDPHYWRPDRRDVSAPAGSLIATVGANGYSSRDVALVPRPERVSVVLEPVGAIEVTVRGVGQRNAFRSSPDPTGFSTIGTLHYRVHWIGAAPGSVPSTDPAWELLAADGQSMDLGSNGSRTIQPLRAGTYWVGVSRGSSPIEWATSVAVDRSPVSVEAAIPLDWERDAITITVDDPDGGDPLRFRHTLRDAMQDTTCPVVRADHPDGRVRLIPESEIPLTILDGRLPGRLELVSEADGRSVTTRVIRRDVVVRTARGRLRVRLAEESDGAEIRLDRLSYHEVCVVRRDHSQQNEPYWTSCRDTHTRGVVEFELEPGTYELTLTPLFPTPDFVVHRTIDVEPGLQTVTLHPPSTIRLQVDFDTPPDWVAVVPDLRDRFFTTGSNDTRVFERPPGAYVIFARYGSRLETMPIRLVSDARFQFAPVPIDALRLERPYPDTSQGLEVGDLLVGIGGARFDDYSQLESILDAVEFLADTVPVTVRRGTRELRVDLPVQSLPRGAPGLWSPTSSVTER